MEEDIEHVFDVKPGERKDFHLKDLHIHRFSELSMPGAVMRGEKEGPTLALTAGVHGDELNGVSIVHAAMDFLEPSQIRGTVICLPSINVWGLLSTSREMIDGRDLNRLFPGLHEGSFASRTAHNIFSMIRRCNYCIDFHTGTGGRRNVPHVRADLSLPGLVDMAKAFGTAVIYNHPGEEGTLRREANTAGVKSILFEGGESGRFERSVVKVGLQGIKNVMSWLRMADWPRTKSPFSLVIDSARWVRAPSGGILEFRKSPGEYVSAKETLAEIDDIFGSDIKEIRAEHDGLIIGVTNRPLVVPGYPIAHILDLTNIGESTKDQIKALKKI